MHKPRYFHNFIALLLLVPSLAHAGIGGEIDYGQPIDDGSTPESVARAARNKPVPLPPRSVQSYGVAYDGDEPMRLNESRLMIPASTMKVITAVTSLRMAKMGPEFKFRNFFDGAIATDNSTLLDPRFSVSGDPTWAHPQYRLHVDENDELTAEDFNETLFHRIDIVVAELVEKKIKNVVGPIMVTSLRPELANVGRPQGWKDYWATNCMATVPTTVMLNGNCAPLTLMSATEARWALPGVTTPVSVQMIPGAETNPTFTPTFDRLGRVTSYTVTGTFKHQFRRNLPVNDNEGWLKNLLIIELKKAGIKYTESVSVKTKYTYSPHRLSVDISSAPLKEILRPCLLESINAIADRLYFENGFQMGMDPDVVAMNTLHELTTAPLTGYVLRDGSGLNPLNRVTPLGMLQLLTKIQDKSVFPFFDDFLALLPVSNQPGTLHPRLPSKWQAHRTKEYPSLYHSDAAKLLGGRVLAKTGHIDRISNLAGYYKDDTNVYIPFVVFSSASADIIMNPGVDEIVYKLAKANED